MSTSLANREKGHKQGMPSKIRGKDVRPHGLSVLPCKDDGSRLCSPPSTEVSRDKILVHTLLKMVGASSPCANQF